MAWDIMDKSSIEDSEGRTTLINEKEEILDSPGNGVWILTPSGVNGIQITLSFPVAGSGKIQYTTDKIGTIKNGSPVAIDWDNGEVSATATDVIYSVTAIRQVNVSGTSKLTVRAQ